MKSVFGSDWSGVLNNNAHVKDGTRNSLLNPNRTASGYLRVKPFKGALETLQWMKENGFPTIHIVSRIDMECWIEERVRAWHTQHGFETVVPQEQVHFCERWHEKTRICQELGITHFVDDRLEVLFYMVGIVPNLFLFRSWAPEDKPFQHLVEEKKVIVVRSWREVRKHLGS